MRVIFRPMRTTASLIGGDLLVGAEIGGVAHPQELGDERRVRAHHLLPGARSPRPGPGSEVSTLAATTGTEGQ